MTKPEPVQMTGTRPWRSALAAAGLFLLATLTAGVSPASAATSGGNRHRPTVTLEVVSPERGATVADSTDLVFAGSNLDRVDVYRRGKLIGNATSDGTSATVTIDTLELRDGRNTLVAVGRGEGHRRDVEVLRVQVDNENADGHPEGATLIYRDEFSGDSLDRNAWCTRYQWWEPTSAPSQGQIDEALATAPDGCFHDYGLLSDDKKTSTADLLDQFKVAEDEARVAGDATAAQHYQDQRQQILTNMNIAVGDDGSYTFDDSYRRVHGFHDTLGGYGLPVPADAQPWEYPQEEQVYRDVNAEGMQMHTQQDGFLSLWATATRPEAPVLTYEAAMIRSTEEFLPTWDAPLYFTARVRSPEVLGTFPAFWLLNGYGDGSSEVGWPPEIDIYEGPYNNDGSFGPGGQTKYQYHVGNQRWTCEVACGEENFFAIGDVLGETEGDVVGFDPEYHDYHDAEPLTGRWIEVGLAWYPDRTCFFFEGEQIACDTYRWAIPDSVDPENPTTALPAQIMLNQAFGGRWAGENGEQIELLPASFDVDHVRVYELPATSADQLPDPNAG